MARRWIATVMFSGAAALSAVCLTNRPAPAQPATTEPASTQPATQPSAAEMFDHLLGSDPVHDAPPIQPMPIVKPPSNMSGGIQPTPQQNLTREGTYVPDHVGRLTKTPDDRWEFTFDADGKALQDPPLRILENSNLALMEDAVTNQSRDLRFRITYMLTEYRGHNYILIDKFIVLADERRPY